MSIRLRLVLIVAVVSTVLVAVGGTVFEVSLASGMHATLEDFLRRSASRLERDLADHRVLLVAPTGRVHPVDDQSTLQVLLRTGQVEYTTTQAGIRALATTVTRERASRGPVFVQRTRAAWHDPRLLLVESDPNRRRLVLVVGASLDELINARRRLLAALVVGGPVIVLIVGVGSWILAGVALRPVERLRREAKAISATDPDRRLVMPKSRDEVARLAHTLNDLLDLLQGAIARQREFVAVASHELRTPIAVLRAEVEVAQRPGRTEGEMRASFGALGPRIAQLVRLSDDLLLLASGDEGALRLHATTQGLEPLVASSLQSLSATAEDRGMSIVLDAEPGVAATVDGVRFQQIIDNLVANAVEHAAPSPLVEVCVRSADGLAIVEVKDRGPGFPAEFLPQAFDRFTRGASASHAQSGPSGGSRRPARRGVGLGLAVVRLLVEAHGGTVEATNRRGGGARVVVRLPRADVGPVLADRGWHQPDLGRGPGDPVGRTAADGLTGDGAGHKAHEAPGTGDADDHQRPLRIAVLAKQVPRTEDLELGPDGRLRRQGTALEMNPYCRRAVAKGVALATASAGSCTVFTLGPPPAEEVLREAIAWGADDGVHLCDPAFAGSDTLATARALAAAVRREGPFDLVLVGRNSIDGGTGQVGPELAELLDLPFAAGVRHMRVAAGVLELGLEHEDGREDAEVLLPALVSVAERLCPPCKVDPEQRAAVLARRIRRLSAAQLGDGPWGEAGSPTKVGSTRPVHHRRERMVLSGNARDQVTAAMELLADRGAIGRSVGAQAVAAQAVGGQKAPDRGTDPPPEPSERDTPWPTAAELSDGLRSELPAEPPGPGTGTDQGAGKPVVGVLIEPWRLRGTELLGVASHLSAALDGTVTALVAPPDPQASSDEREMTESLGSLGADEVLQVSARRAATILAPEDVAAALTRWARVRRPRIVVAPSTTYGCEVAARMAAALDAGLVSDAVTAHIVGGSLVAGKPALAGALLADISCTSSVQLVTVRPGAFILPPPRARKARLGRLEAAPRGRVLTRCVHRDDEVDALTRASVIVGVGGGVDPSGYRDVHELVDVLGAEMVATRKVTDRGWAPRSRQVGVTGRTIAPRLYVAIGLSGALNHMLAVQASDTVLAINTDPTAPVFQGADIGIVGDWRVVVPLLVSRLRSLSAGVAPSSHASPSLR